MVWAERHQLQGGKYVIGEVLGQGGFGITYEALHVLLQQQVVIKTPHEYWKNDSDYDRYVKRFIREARLLAKLSEDSHPHIVRVSDLFQEDEIHCLVMEFIPGESLSELVRRRGALPEVDAINYIRQIGEALAFVHQAGLIHRDAHPGNIMLRSKDKAILIDFSIAGELVPTTVSSKSFGSPFAPYEQMNGSREPTVDVYCLAATLYYAVTGERPTTSFDRKLYSAGLAPPKQLNRHISDRLNEGILKGMALEAKDRPQSMQEWLKLLEASKVVTPPPVAPTHRQEVVDPRLNKTPAPHPEKPDTQKTRTVTRRTRTIPWDRLIIILPLGTILPSYSFIGFLLLILFGRFEAGVVAVVVAVAAAGAVPIAGAGAGLGAGVMAVAVIVAVAGIVAWAVFGAVAGVVTWAVSVAGVAAVARIGEALLVSFSEFQTFVILVGTSWLGLWLGVQLGFIFL